MTDPSSPPAPMTAEDQQAIERLHEWVNWSGPRPADEFRDLLSRRTRLFLDWAGISTRPVSMLLQEAYLQGMNDAIDALQSMDTTP